LGLQRGAVSILALRDEDFEAFVSMNQIGQRATNVAFEILGKFRQDPCGGYTW